MCHPCREQTPAPCVVPVYAVRPLDRDRVTYRAGYRYDLVVYRGGDPERLGVFYLHEDARLAADALNGLPAATEAPAF